MSKSVKHCSVCQENFGDRFSFCPVCGSTLKAVEVGASSEAFVPANGNNALSREEKIAAVAAAPVSTDGAAFVQHEAPNGNGANGFSHNQPEAETFKPEPQIDDSPIITGSETMLYGHDSYHLTILQPPSSVKRYMSFGAMAGFFFLLTMVTALWIWGLYQTNLDIEAVDDEYRLGPVFASNEAPEMMEEKPPPVKKDDEGGGGGGGGRNDPKPASEGKLAPQMRTPPELTPSHTIVQKNFELKQQASTVGDDNRIDPTPKPYGIPGSKFTDPSDGPGRGSGQGDGTGNGQGNGRGDGSGNGDGTGRGNGRGNGYGDGEGDGVGEPPPVRKVEPAPAVTEKERILSQPKAQYTEEARKNNVQGVVRLKVTFSASGTITNITPLNNLPYGLTEQAIAAARRIQFVPRKRNGQPVSFSKTVEYHFNIY